MAFKTKKSKNYQRTDTSLAKVELSNCDKTASGSKNISVGKKSMEVAAKKWKILRSSEYLDVTKLDGDWLCKNPEFCKK